MKNKINKLWKKLFFSYLDGLELFFYTITFSVFFIILYRIKIYNLIKTIYQDFSSISFFKYFSLYVFNDINTIILLSFIILMLFTIITINKKYKIITSIIFLSTISIFLLSSIEFFKVYETTFQPIYTKNESGALFEIIYSSLSEASFEFYFKLLISIIIIPTPFLIIKNRINIIIPILFIKNRLLTIITITSPFTLLLFLLSISLLFNSEKKYIDSSSDYQQISKKKSAALLKDFSINPIYNFIIKENHSDLNHEDQVDEEFSFKLNTNSILSNKLHPRINIIPRGKKYNIIFYFFESTHRKYIDIKIKNKFVTETWQRLSKNSIFFENHYANFPLSANAMLSIFTSAYDHYSNELAISKYPKIKLLTIPEILKPRGYRTCLVHTGSLEYVSQNKFLKHRKFDKIFEYRHLIKLQPQYENVGWGIDERSMIDPSIQFLKKNRGKPFFISYFPLNPHHPYAIPNEKYRITGEIPKNLSDKNSRWLNYINSLHFADAALGQLIDRLEEEGLMKNTLLFLFADHGEAFYQHRKNYNHRHYAYEENVHVPFLIYNKNLFKKKIRFTGVTRHIDILPTVLDILSIKGRPEQEGISLLSSRPEQLALLHANWREDYNGLRDGKWKYIIRTEDKYEQLYDLSQDPGEKKNLAMKRPKLIKKFRSYIKKSQMYKVNYYKRILKR